MCACGCFLLLIVGAGAAWAAMRGMWPVAILIVAAAAALTWFGSRAIVRNRKAKPS